MRAECFIDTSVIVYAAAGRGKLEAKRRKALALLEEADFGLSSQVLQEFYVVVTRKIQTPLPPAEALDWIEQFEVFPCVAIEPGLVKIAAEISERHQMSYWDGAIVAAAEILNAGILYSEDLNHQQYYGSVRAANPFL